MGQPKHKVVSFLMSQRIPCLDLPCGLCDLGELVYGKSYRRGLHAERRCVIM